MEQVCFLILLYAPLSGILACTFFSVSLSKRVSWIASCAALFASVPLWRYVDPALVGWTPLVHLSWLSPVGMDLELGLSPTSLPFLILSQGICAIALWKDRQGSFWISGPTILLCQFALTLAFCSFDMLVFCAAVLFLHAAFFVLASASGSPNSPHRLLTYLFIPWTGALLMISAALILGALHLEQFQVFSTKQAAIRELAMGDLPPLFGIPIANGLFWLMATGSLLCSPFVPSHLWLSGILDSRSVPARVLAAGSASLLLTFGWLNWILPSFPDVFVESRTTLALVACASILYAAVLALSGRDLMRWIAAATAAHASFVILGFTSISLDGFLGAYVHGFSWPPVAVGILCLTDHLERTFKTTNMHDLGPVMPIAPRLGIFLGLYLAAAVAVPGSALFNSLLLVMSGTLALGTSEIYVAAGSWALYAASVVLLARALLVGNSPHKGIRTIPDLRLHAAATAVLLLAVTFSIGLYPSWLRKRVEPTLKAVSRSPLRAQILPQGGRS